MAFVTLVVLLLGIFVGLAGVARLLDRLNRDTAPGRLSMGAPGGMNQGPHVRWSDNSPDLIGSAQNIQGKRAASYEPALTAGNIAGQGSRNTRTLTSSVRSSRSLWVDKSQR